MMLVVKLAALCLLIGALPLASREVRVSELRFVAAMVGRSFSRVGRSISARP